MMVYLLLDFLEFLGVVFDFVGSGALAVVDDQRFFDAVQGFL